MTKAWNRDALISRQCTKHWKARQKKQSILAMTTAISFSGRVLPQGMCSKAMAGFTLSPLPFKRTCQFEHNKMKILERGLYMKTKANSKLFNDNNLFLVMPSKKNSILSFLSPSDTIQRFYTCINEKNLKQLGDYISKDCQFEDCSFPKPFQGKKEVMQFFEQLTASMGRNVKFNIGHVCEGDEFTAGITWHLEWKKSPIPFTKGCSFIECSKEGERLLIKKAQVMVESPVKPGGLVLTLLKTVTSLFDDFPKTAEWFLNSPHVILQWTLKFYTILLAPFINPLLTGYINLWNFTTRLLGYTLNILFFISKIFFK